MLVSVDDDQDFSVELETWLDGDQPKTIGALEDVFAEKGFAVAILLLMFLPALPIPTGGITHIFEVITVVLAFGMVLGRQTMWLPDKWRRKELGVIATKGVPFIVRRVRWFERFSRPRLARLYDQRWFLRLLGLAVIGFTVAAALAPPFSGLDTLPALGVVVIALSIILEDVLILAIGGVIGSGGVVLIITLGAAAVRFFKHLF